MQPAFTRVLRTDKLKFSSSSRRKISVLDEVKRVYPLKHLNALNTVGYKELFKVLDGEWELPMAVERIKKNTRVYAKKQMTWYKHDADIHWLDADHMNTQEMLKTIEDEVFVA